VNVINWLVSMLALAVQISGPRFCPHHLFWLSRNYTFDGSACYVLFKCFRFRFRVYV